MIELYISGFILSSFFASLILLKKNKERKDFFLIFFILLFGLESLTIYAALKGWHKTFPEIFFGDIIYWTLLGPLLYFYISLTINTRFKFKILHLLHLLPLIIVFSSYGDYAYYFAKGIHYKTYLAEKNSIYTNFGVFIFESVSPFYYIWVIIKIIKHRKKIPDYFSNTKNVSLSWIFYFTNGFAFYLLSGAIILLVEQLFDYKIFNIYNLLGLVSIFYIIGIGYFGFKQKGIFMDFDEPNKINDINPVEIDEEKQSQAFSNYNIAVNKNEINKLHYSKSKLKSDETIHLLNQLTNYMENQKPYLDCDFNLKNLANSINTTQHKLSQLLNEHLNTNFFDFVNKYRIEEVKKIMNNPDSDNYTFLAIAFDAGFNSKSTFYTAFKKFTNQTPSEYKKTLKNTPEYIS